MKTHISKQHAAKEQLKTAIADISHQLKTPLSALSMYNEIILDANFEPEVVEKFAKNTEHSLERMKDLINHLLQILKMDAGMIELHKESHNISRLFESLKESFELRCCLEQKQILIQGDEDAILYCDEEWLKESFSNLIKNALDYTEKSGVIQISWEVTPICMIIKVLRYVL